MIDIGEGKVETRSFDVEILNEKYLDVAPVGGAVQVSGGTHSMLAPLEIDSFLRLQWSADTTDAE